MRFFSDNAAAACPEALAALTAANRIDAAYDGDEYSGRLNRAFSDDRSSARTSSAARRARWISPASSHMSGIWPATPERGRLFR